MLRWLTGWARDRRLRFRFWDGSTVREVRLDAVAAVMRELRPDLGRVLEKFMSVDSPWSLETAEMLDVMRAAFGVPECSDPTGFQPGLTESEVLNLFQRFWRSCIQAAVFVADINV